MKASVDTRAVNFILSILVFCTFGAKVDRYAYRYLPCPKSGTVKGVIDHSLFDMVGNHQKYLPLLKFIRWRGSQFNLYMFTQCKRELLN